MSTIPPDFEQIPARMVNELCYCPRLFYLEYVQREWAHNTDTLEGRLVHRRVDRQQGEVPSATELSGREEIHARSVLIGSDRLGAIARIEAEDGALVPVDYKRGSPPSLERVPEGAYEPDRVQLCLQGLLLREEGYRADYGIIYFAETRTRVRIDFTEELIARTLSLLEEARHLARSGEMPPPLVNSPKCPRCSLVGICLPDETNLLKQSAAEASAPVRRLTPARDDRLPVYVQGHGHTIGLNGETLEVRSKGEVIAAVRLLEISHLVLFGNVQLSAQALRELASRDSIIVHLSHAGWLVAVTTPPPSKNIELRQRQFAAAADAELCLRLARAFVAGKIRNARTLLRRNGRDLPEKILRRLAQSRRRAERATALAELLGIEGTAARDYFAHFSMMFKGDAGSGRELSSFDFSSRNRRPPRDPVNALLSFLYAMLLKDVLATLVGVGFDPYLGFYHQPKYGRPALALDLMEEFRPIVADSVAIGLINNGEIRPSDFIARAGSVALTPEGRKRVIEAYERRLNTLVTHPLFNYPMSYRRIFEVQARLLARFLTGEVSIYPSFCTR